MIVTTHQADLLPYSGFWFKMAKADLFDLKIYDQFQARGYQRRVPMRGSWASIPVVGSPTRARICDVRIRPDEARQVLSDHIVGRYRGARNWEPMGKALLEMIADIDRSFTHLIDAMSATTPARLDETITFFGQQMTVRQLWVLTAVHLHEHLGQLIAYTRTNGVTPPWSRQGQ